MGVTSRREREKEARRSQIVDAAQRVFRRNGYLGTTMDEVAAEAELSKGTLYLYFPSKFELFAELSHRALSPIHDRFQAVLEKSVSGREQVDEMLRFWVVVGTEKIHQFRLAISWIASDDHTDIECDGVCSHKSRVGTIIQFLAMAVANGQKDGSLPHKGDAPTLACQMWSGMMGALLFSSRIEDTQEKFPFSVQAEGYMETFVDLLIAGLAHES